MDQQAEKPQVDAEAQIGLAAAVIPLPFLALLLLY
jgi:hypothetical protein